MMCQRSEDLKSWEYGIPHMGIVKSFAGGLLMTLVLVVLVPIVCNQYISPAIVDAVGDNHILMLSSEMIVNLLMWAVILGFMLLLGGSMILKKCGIFGVLGLIVAYWLLGDVTDALIPLLMLILSVIILKTIQIKKEKKQHIEKRR